MNPQIIDYHCHSHFSDGHLSPEKLINLAIKNQVHELALTDHDSLDGCLQMKLLCEKNNINWISGIEISTRWKLHDIHVVGLNFDIAHASMKSLVIAQKKARHIRAQKIAESIELLGISHAYEKALEIAGHDNLARPHFAKLLLNEGKVNNLQQAFKQYLTRGRKCYVPTPWIPIDEAVKVIHECGGVAVLAHPLKYGFTATKLRALISLFKASDGKGIEVVAGDVNSLQIEHVNALCNEFELLASTGSDFHGEIPYGVSLGMQKQLPPTLTPIWTLWR